MNLARALLIFTGVWTALASATGAPVDGVSLESRAWFEARTAHFNIYSCGNRQAVSKLAGRLEQFCKAYAQPARRRWIRRRLW